MARTLEVSIPIQDVLDDISDETIWAECINRKLWKLAIDDDDMNQVEAAYLELLVGRFAEARTILERLVRPKWRNIRECKDAYVSATQRN